MRRLDQFSSVILGFACLLAVACGGGGGGGGPVGPTDPSPTSSASLATSQGSFTVQANGYDVDLQAIDRAIGRAYDKARDQIGGRADDLRFDGYTLEVMPESWELAGQHLRETRTIRMRVGDERVVTHELQHVFAWDLDRPHDCKVLQDHPHGYDLNCARLP